MVQLLQSVVCTVYTTHHLSLCACLHSISSGYIIAVLDTTKGTRRNRIQRKVYRIDVTEYNIHSSTKKRGTANNKNSGHGGQHNGYAKQEKKIRHTGYWMRDKIYCVTFSSVPGPKE